MPHRCSHISLLRYSVCRTYERSIKLKFVEFRRDRFHPPDHFRDSLKDQAGAPPVISKWCPTDEGRPIPARYSATFAMLSGVPMRCRGRKDSMHSGNSSKPIVKTKIEEENCIRGRGLL